MRMRALLVLSFCVFPLFADEPVVLPEYAAIRNGDAYATAEEYAAARNDKRFKLTRVSYESDGLTVFAYLYAPVARPAKPLPAVIFNRGSWTWKEFAGEYLTAFHRLASAGFVVVAPMIRGSGGAEGRDELGGADLSDLLNITKVLEQLPYVDRNAVFMYGQSRGAMMTYQAIRERFPMRAAAVYGGFSDISLMTGPGTRFHAATYQIWPDYDKKKSEIDQRRSALAWADRFDTPVLIMHGTADRDVNASHAIALAAKLQELGKPYELIVRKGGNHFLSDWRAERDAHAIEWFRRHMN